MENNTSIAKTLSQQASELNFNALLNAYCREFSNWSRYVGIPKYDDVLRNELQKTNHQLHIRIDFSRIGYEVFVPVKFYADSGRHVFNFPVFARHQTTDEIKSLSPADFLALAIDFASDEFPDTQTDLVKERLNNSIENLAKFLDFHQKNGKPVNFSKMNFLETEQSLVLGHNAHPLPKGRKGFANDEELFLYSPETKGQFQLAYFLIDPTCVNEANAEGFDITDYFRAELLDFIGDEQLRLIDSHAHFKVVPMHPWEANYLLKQSEVQALQNGKQLFYLGQFGAFYTPTSSVRTVYNAQSEWMIKFSLHVKITNSERVNLVRELHRGYDISRLLKTNFGKQARLKYPEIDFITDPAFITVNHNGKPIDGFNTSIRYNPFKEDATDKNVTLIAALCQDSVLGQKPRIANVIEEAALLAKKGIEQTAIYWFEQYLHTCVGPLVGLLNDFGMAFEFHQQNVLLELDANFFPAKFYFRDNQGFFFRAGMSDELERMLPGLAAESGSIVPEEYIHPKYTYYLLINNILGVVNAIASNALAPEEKLIHLVYEEFKRFEHLDHTGFVDYVINKRSWEVKGNMLTNFCGIDEASAPIENPAIYRQFPNPLHKYFFCQALIKPKIDQVLYERYHPKENINITLRSFDIDRDLEMVHQWFNQEHCKAIWKMDGPIKNLELFYRQLIPSDASHALIGEVNGQPNFTMEPYWPMRDGVGACYDALPTDYGSHLLIAPENKDDKYSFPTGQALLDYVFMQDVVGKCIGEAAVESRAMHMFATRLGFKYQKVITMPHKDANLTFCYREWYWEKFPEAKSFAEQIETEVL